MFHSTVNYAAGSTQTSFALWNEGEHSVAQVHGVAIQLFLFPPGIQHFSQIATFCTSVTHMLWPLYKGAVNASISIL